MLRHAIVGVLILLYVVLLVLLTAGCGGGTPTSPSVATAAHAADTGRTTATFAPTAPPCTVIKTAQANNAGPSIDLDLNAAIDDARVYVWQGNDWELVAGRRAYRDSDTHWTIRVADYDRRYRVQILFEGQWGCDVVRDIGPKNECGGCDDEPMPPPPPPPPPPPTPIASCPVAVKIHGWVVRVNNDALITLSVDPRFEGDVAAVFQTYGGHGLTPSFPLERTHVTPITVTHTPTTFKVHLTEGYEGHYASWYAALSCQELPTVLTALPVDGILQAAGGNTDATMPYGVTAP